MKISDWHRFHQGFRTPTEKLKSVFVRRILLLREKLLENQNNKVQTQTRLPIQSKPKEKDFLQNLDRIFFSRPTGECCGQVVIFHTTSLLNSISANCSEISATLRFCLISRWASPKLNYLSNLTFLSSRPLPTPKTQPSPRPMTAFPTRSSTHRG